MDWVRQIPIGQFVDVPPGWLRRLDPRVKISWSVMFLLSPILAGPIWRLGLMIGLFLLTIISGLPARVWRRSLPGLLALALLVGVLGAMLPVGEVGPGTPQRPPGELRLLPSSPAAADGASPYGAKTDRATPESTQGEGGMGSIPSRSGMAWEWVHWGPVMVGPVPLGPLVITRRSAELGLNGATLLVTVIQSTNLMLLTTPPEELVWALNWFLTPLRLLGVPVERLGFTLLLSLRFLPLVQEELQNLLRSIATRAVNARQLGRRGVLALALALAERLFRNVLLRSEQGAEALLARGAAPLHPSLLEPPGPVARWGNALGLVALILVLGMRWKVGGV
jgi:energy-coupling factor transport system permease protein